MCWGKLPECEFRGKEGFWGVIEWISLRLGQVMSIQDIVEVEL